MTQKKLFIIDCLALAYRCFYAYPELKTSTGRLTGVVYGASMFLSNTLSANNPDYVVAATDPGTPTFRHEMYSQYKANRKEKPADFLQQLPDFYTLLEKMKIPLLKMPRYEADDIIGSLAAKFACENLKVFIVSADKDFIQCITENVVMYKPGKWPEFEIIDQAKVMEKMGVAPKQIIDILALTGDAADNVPGVEGIGEKRAQILVKSFSSVEGIYENIHNISGKKSLLGLIDGRESALLSKKLVTIKTDLDIPLALEDMTLNTAPNDELRSFYKELEFKENT